MAGPKFTIDDSAQVAGSRSSRSRTSDTSRIGDVYFGPVTAIPAPPPPPKPKDDEGFWTKTARAALGETQKAAGRLVEYLPETLESGLAGTAELLGSSRGLPKGLTEAIVRAQTSQIVTPENVQPYRRAVAPVSKPLVEAGQRQVALAGPGTFKSPSQQESFSLGETVGFVAEQGLRSAGPAALALGVGALTRSPAAARAILAGGSYGQSLGGILESQQEQGFQDVSLASKAALASAALDVISGGEAKVAQAIAKDAQKQLFREGAKNLTKDLLKIGGAEAGTEVIQTGFERAGARQDLFSREALGEYIDSAAAGFGGGVVLGGGVRLLTGNRKPAETKTDLDATGSNLLKTEGEQQKPAPSATASFIEKDADDNDVVNIETIRANPKMALDELSELYSRDNIITSLAGDTEVDDYTTSLGARLHRAINSPNAKSIPNLVRNLKRDIDPDMHGEEVAAQRSPLVAKAALMLGDYVGMRNEAMAADERATNPALIAETVAEKNASEVARVQGARQAEVDAAAAEQARIDAEREMKLAAAAKEVEGIHRKGFLEAVAKDPKTRDPVARFTALLKRNGFDPEITAQEQIELTKAAVGAEQRLASEAAQMDMTVAEYKQKLAEDEMRQRQAESGTASMEARIREAGSRAPAAAAAPKPAPMPAGKTNATTPENFRLEMQSELTDADIEAQQKAAARRQAKEDRALAKANERAERRAAKQGEMFTPTGRVRKATAAAAAPAPAPVAAPAPKVTVSTKLKEKARAAKEGQKPKGSVSQRERADEKRKAAEAGRSNRLEQIRAGAEKIKKVKPKTPKQKLAEVKAREAAAKAEQEARIAESKAKEEATEAPPLEGDELFAYQNVSGQIDTARDIGDITPQQSMKLKAMIGARIEPGMIQQAIRDAAAQNKPSKTGAQPKKLRQARGVVSAVTNPINTVMYSIYRMQDAWSALTGKEQRPGGKLVDLLQDKDVLDKMTPMQREVAATLADVIRNDVNVESGNENFRLDNANTLGQTEFEGRMAPRVRVRGLSTLKNVQTLIHEAVHVALVAKFGIGFVRLKDIARLNNSPELLRLRAQAVSLMNAYDAMLEATASTLFPPYGMTSIDEFVAEGMTNPKFQKFLDKGGMWTRFVEFVRKALGMPPKFQSQLNAVLEAGANLIEGSKDLSRMKDVSEAPDMPERVRLAQRISGRLENQNVPPQIGRQTSYVAQKFNEFHDKFARKAMTHTTVEGAVRAGVGHAAIYQDAMLDQGRVRANIEQKVSKVLELFDSLPKALRKVGGPVNTLLQDSTTSGKWAFAPSWLKEGTYTVDPALEQRFNELPAEGQKFIEGVFKTNHDLREMVMAAVDESIDQPFDRLIKEAEDAGRKDEAAQLRREREGWRSRKTSLFNVDPTKPYASLRRTGKFVVSAKSQEYMDAIELNDTEVIKELQSDPEHNFFNKYDTKAEALAAKARLEGAEFNFVTPVLAVAEDESMNEIYGGGEAFQAFQSIFKAIDQRQELSEQAKRVLQSVVTDLHLMSLSNSSARKSEVKRKNVYGGDLDMVRNFATQSRAMAHHIASLKNNDMIIEAFSGMNKDVRNAPDPMEASLFRNELTRRHMAGLRYRPNTLVEALKRFTGLYKVAFSPSFYIQNFTQVPLMVGPEMAARFGATKTAKYFENGMEGVAKAWAGTKWTESLNIDQLPEKYRAVVQRLADMGLIDVGLDSDLGSMKSLQGRAGERWGAAGEVLDAGTETFEAAANLAQDLTRKQESINRTVTAIAGYQAQLDRTGNVQSATDYAIDLVRNTMFTYDQFNSPTYMQGAGGIPFQFRKFQLGQVTLLLRHIRNGYTDPNITEGERLVARAALKYQIGTAAITAGIRGLPGAAALIWLYNAFAGDDDDAPEDFDAKVRKFVGDKTTSDFLLYGAPALADVNLSGMLGFGSTFSVLPYTDIELTPQGIAVAAFALGGAGPATVAGGLSAAKKMADDLGEGREDYYRGLEKMLPKGFTNLIQAYRESTQGVTSPKKGTELVSADEVKYVDTLKTVLGIPSVKTAERYRKQDAEIAIDRFFKEKTTSLKSRFVRAIDAGDTAAREEIKAEWRKMQDAREAAGKKRQPITVLLRAKAEREREEALNVGGVQYRAKDERYRKALAEEAADEE